MHKVEKSRAGGVAIFFSFLVGIFFLGVNVNAYIMAGFFLVFILGIYDDIFGYSSKVKFFWLSVAAIFLCLGGMYIESLGTFLGVDMILPTSLAMLFSIFAIVGFINAMNLIDGLDGLSSGVAIVMLGAYAYIGYKYADTFLLYTSATLIVSLLAFLFYNWYPSKLFMGDNGSLTLGFVIVVLSIHSVQMDYISAVSILLITAVPILDTLIVMIRRIRRRKNPFNPDMTHVHHIILKQYYKDVSKTTKIIILLQIVFSSIGLGFKVRDDTIILAMFILLFILFYNLLTPKIVVD
ncbi:hypothetical protein M947_10495 [Sulfurimonas hongkongensis]|uniref:UDP-N-acetylmuramyl pentapeptide phosphotransferase n=1 Tax=Sulfurimonas hongkongensis TaxID=1172190 RepID=T0JCT6_9BACT|nr:MraY family glycosyltransferase [Sulfurimonas hongkongensis]EQB34617.1 hypothetical protein M947_10495 [Sulfurimonas hongkongensis]